MSRNSQRRQHTGPAAWPQLHSFSIGLKGSPEAKEKWRKHAQLVTFEPGEFGAEDELQFQEVFFGVGFVFVAYSDHQDFQDVCTCSSCGFWNNTYLQYHATVQVLRDTHIAQVLI